MLTALIGWVIIGVLGAMVVGLIGALIGGFLWRLVVSFVGAVLPLLIVRAVTGGRRRRYSLGGWPRPQRIGLRMAAFQHVE